jgi:3-deoxy-D-manno-octulosonic-acid transferase
MATTATEQTRQPAAEASLRWGSWLMGLAAVGFNGYAVIFLDTLGHLGLIYLATVIFVAGALLALRGIIAQHRG